VDGEGRQSGCTGTTRFVRSSEVYLGGEGDAVSLGRRAQWRARTTLCVGTSVTWRRGFGASFDARPWIANMCVGGG
jgi:hypothetical protein